MTEKEKMINGLPYDPRDAELARLRKASKTACAAYNLLPPDSEGMEAALMAMLGAVGKNSWIEQGFKADYGFNIFLGDNVFINYNCVMLDCAPVKIGDNVFIGPNCGFYTAVHPLKAAERNTCFETAKPITVCDDVWLGGNVTVLPGVTIGKGAVIGAGSVVTKDVPPGCVAVGNPCAVIKELL